VARLDSALPALDSEVRFCLRIHLAHIAGCAFCNEDGAVSISIPHSELRIPNLKKRARVTTADAEQTAVAAFLPWRDS